MSTIIDGKAYRANCTSNEAEKQITMIRNQFSAKWRKATDKEMSTKEETFSTGARENKKIVVVVITPKILTKENTFIISSDGENGSQTFDYRPRVKFHRNGDGSGPLKSSDYTIQRLGEEANEPVYTQVYTFHQYMSLVYADEKNGRGSQVLIFVGD